MDHVLLPRTPSRALRWIVALLLLVAGGAALVPAVEADELGRVQSSVVVDRQQWAARRRTRPQPLPARPRRRARVIAAAVATSVRTLLVPTVRRGPPRTPCVVALT